LLDLAPNGVAELIISQLLLGVSYTSFSPLPNGGILSVALPPLQALLLRGIILCGVRTFLP